MKELTFGWARRGNATFGSICNYKRINHKSIGSPIFQLLLIFCQYLTRPTKTRFQAAISAQSNPIGLLANAQFLTTTDESVRSSVFASRSTFTATQPPADQFTDCGQKAKSIRCDMNRSGSNLSFPLLTTDPIPNRTTNDCYPDHTQKQGRK